MDIIDSVFSGLIPRLSSRELPAGASTTATNCDFRNRKIRALDDLGSSLGTGDTTIYLDGSTWRTWSTRVSVVQSPVSDSRIIYMDGTQPKVRDGATEYPLGVPAPTSAPSVATAAKTVSPLDLEWHSFYEEPDGSRVDIDLVDLTVPANEPTETTPGKVYTLGTIPTKVTATGDARFIMWAKVNDSDGVYLGKVIPSPSFTKNTTDAVYQGSELSGGLVVTTTAVFTFGYDTSRSSTYKAKRYYVLTYVRKWGSGGEDESGPSTTSTQIAVDPSQNCNLTSIPTAPAGYGITHVRIYRTETGELGETDYFYVDEITDGTATYLDDNEGSAVTLNSILDTSGYTTPANTLKGVRYHPGGFLVAYKGKYLHCSKPYAPHLWGKDFFPVDFAIRGLGVVDQSIAVLTAGQPVWFTGSSPGALLPDYVRVNLACRSSTSIAVTDTSVAYASTRGAVEISPAGAAIITDSFYDGDQWEALGPSTMKMTFQDRRLYIFTDSGLKILRKEGQGFELTETADTADGLFVDPDTDKLYVSESSTIKEWGAGSARTYTYQSRTFVASERWAPSICRVSIESGSVTLTLYGDGLAVYSQAVTSGDFFWLPELPRAKTWVYKIVGSVEFQDVMLLEAMP